MLTDNSAGIIKEAKELLRKGEHVAAVKSVNIVLDSDTENVEALYILGVCQRYLKKTDDALQTIQRLKALAPTYGRAYQEEGHSYRQLDDTQAAAAAYEQAVKLNPALLASWKALRSLHKRHGAYEEAAKADAYVQHYSDIPPELISVASLIHVGHLFKAEQL